MAAHTDAGGPAAAAHTATPVVTDVERSPEKNANDTSIDDAKPSMASESTRSLTFESSARAASTRPPQPQNRFAARRQPHRTISNSSAPSGSENPNTASASSPRPCQLSASASTIAPGSPPPRSNAKRANFSP